MYSARQVYTLFSLTCRRGSRPRGSVYVSRKKMAGVASTWRPVIVSGREAKGLGKGFTSDTRGGEAATPPCRAVPKEPACLCLGVPRVSYVISFRIKCFGHDSHH